MVVLAAVPMVVLAAVPVVVLVVAPAVALVVAPAVVPAAVLAVALVAAHPYRRRRVRRLPGCLMLPSPRRRLS